MNKETAVRVFKLALFSGSVSATGNLIAQYFSFKQTQHRSFSEYFDPLPPIRFFVYSFSFTPVAYRWHCFLDARFPLPKSGSAKTLAVAESQVHTAATNAVITTGRALSVLKRMTVDQVFFGPVATGCFTLAMGALEGLHGSELVERWKTQFPRLLVASYMLWPAAQLVNFSVVPLPYRVPFGSVVSLFWNTYLSWNNMNVARRKRDGSERSKGIEGEGGEDRASSKSLVAA